MRVRFTPQKRKSHRSGFTLIELLVVISIIAVLASLVLPGVQQARETARRTQCLNNMRNIGMALQTFATERRGALPPLYGRDMVRNDASVGGDWGPASWAVHLLPYVEQRGLYDRLFDESLRTAGQGIAVLGATNIEIYTCPDDPNDGADGAMSFVLNAGYTTQDRWTGSLAGHRVDSYIWPAVSGSATSTQNINVTTATGVFFPERAPVAGSAPPEEIYLSSPGYKTTMDKVTNGDGLTQTIFVSENLDTPNWSTTGTSGIVTVPAGTSSVSGSMTSGAGNGGFMGYRLGDSGFAVRLEGTGQDPTNVSSASAGLALSFTGNPFALAPQQASRINENLGIAVEGTSPRPSSLHPGTVNVIFGDGSGRNIAQNIDGTVYVRLVSSNGNRFGQNILSSDDY